MYIRDLYDTRDVCDVGLYEARIPPRRNRAYDVKELSQ